MENLAKALVAFRKAVPGIPMNGLNPYFHSKFSTLEDIHRIIDPVLAENGLAVMQFPVSEDKGVGVATIVLHESGEMIEREFVLPLAQDDPQGGGAAITYARRYAISAALSLVTDEDDDAEAATGRRKAVRDAGLPKGTTRGKAKNKARGEAAMSRDKREQLKKKVNARIKGAGGPDDTEREVLTWVAQQLGHASVIQVTDEEFDAAIKTVDQWGAG